MRGRGQAPHLRDQHQTHGGGEIWTRYTAIGCGDRRARARKIRDTRRMEGAHGSRGSGANWGVTLLRRDRRSSVGFALPVPRNRSFQSDSVKPVIPKVIQNEYTVLIGQFSLLDEISSVGDCGALNRTTLEFESLRRYQFLLVGFVHSHLKLNKVTCDFHSHIPSKSKLEDALLACCAMRRDGVAHR